MHRLYENYDAALLDCGSVGYSNSELTQVVVQKNITYSNNLSNNSFYDLNSLRTILGIAWGIGYKSIKVIDFGGGGGQHYQIARHILGDSVNIQWGVVETEAMCQAAEKITNEQLRYFNHVQNAKNSLGTVDMVFASSSLQYCPDPVEALQSIIDISAKYIFITRTPFNSGSEKLVSIQSSRLSANGPGPLPNDIEDKEILYPITFIPVEDVIKQLKTKYRILFKTKEEPPTLFLEGRPVNEYYGLFCELK